MWLRIALGWGVKLEFCSEKGQILKTRQKIIQKLYKWVTLLKRYDQYLYCRSREPRSKGCRRIEEAEARPAYRVE